MKSYRSVVRFFVMTYLAFGFFLYFFQEHFLYHPTPESSNHELNIERFAVEEDVVIKTVVVNPGHDNAVLYFGGNAEAVEYNAEAFKTSLAEQTIYLINYRGYGGSTGIPSEAALYRDAIYLYDRLRSRHRNIAVIGRSLGSGVATYLAAERDVKRLVLITPFDSIENIAQQRYPVYPITLMLNDKYDSLSRADKIKAKVLILVAENDRIIEYWSSERLLNAFKHGQVAVDLVEDAGHNDISQAPDYYRAIAHFLGGIED